MFLTTQYLEEADRLADRVGIIDHGRDRGRGHARRAQVRDRRAERRGGAADPPGTASGWRGAVRFAGRRAARSHADEASRCASARRRQRPRRRRAGARRRRASRSPTCSCTRRPSTTCSSRRPAASLEGAGEDEEDEAEPGAAEHAGRGGVSAASGRRSCELARRSFMRTPRQPAQVVPVADLPALPARGEHGRARRGHRHPRLPDRLLPDLRARRPVHPGRASSPCSTAARTSRATSRPASSTGSR